ncbi:serine protease [Caballeronia jiangsuensis]|uniref:Serine protease n=1 Tax=Caballeronia jiangsuensis TaxID=1458357 RepID=A0ABW9CZ53_9BURK
MRFLIASLITLATCVATSVPCQAIDWSTTRKSIVFVTASVTEPSGSTTTETGTGFIITTSGYVITANHVIGPNPNVKITVRIGSRSGEELIAYHVDAPVFSDVVLLQLPDSKGPYNPVMFHDPKALKVMDHLETGGFPLSSDFSVVDGTLSNQANPRGLWQVSIPLNYGNSGGPVFDVGGGVIGMVVGGIRGAQQVNYILPLNILSPLLNVAGLTWPPFTPSSNANAAIVVPDFSAPALPSVSELNQKGGASNCHEITVISSGFPPRYEKKTECN